MRPDSKICGICQCTFGDGDCVHFNDHRGNDDDPYVPEPVIDEVDGNMVESGPSGLGAFLPPFFLDPPAVHVYSPVDYPMAFDAAQIIKFGEERYDTDSMHDEENEITRLTIKTPGLYAVTLNVRWSKTNDSTATGDMAIFIRKNGSEFLGIVSEPVPGPDSFSKQSLTVEVPLVSGDYLEAMGKQDIEIDDEPKVMFVTAERMSPNFSAMFIRPIEAMDILGVPESQ